jgi:hypothetical protein
MRSTDFVARHRVLALSHIVHCYHLNRLSGILRTAVNSTNSLLWYILIACRHGQSTPYYGGLSSRVWRSSTNPIRSQSATPSPALVGTSYNTYVPSLKITSRAIHTSGTSRCNYWPDGHGQIDLPRYGYSNVTLAASSHAQLLSIKLCTTHQGMQRQ